MGLELAGRSEGRELERGLWIGLVGVLILATLLLLLVSVLWGRQADREGALGSAGVINLAMALARGSHCVLVSGAVEDCQASIGVSEKDVVVVVGGRQDETRRDEALVKARNGCRQKKWGF